MIKQTDILTAINRLLIEVYPEYMVYIQACPKDFERPSFLLEIIRISQTDICRSSVEKTVYFTVTFFAETDKYYRSDPEELADIQDTILQHFNIGYVMVGDRAIKVKGSSGGIDADRAYIDLQFEFIDNRYDNVEQEPVATSVTTRIQEV